MKRAAAALLLVGVACSTPSGVKVTSSIPKNTCVILAEPLAATQIGTVADSLGELLHRGPTDVTVFVNARALDSDVETIRAAVAADPAVDSMTYLDHDAAHAEFESLFSDQQSIATSLTPSETPTSFKVILKNLADTNDFRTRMLRVPQVYDVLDLGGTVRHDMSLAAQEVLPRLDAVLKSGGTSALVELVRVNQRLYGAAKQDSSARLFGSGGLLSSDDLLRLENLVDTVKGEVTHDCGN